MESATGKSVGLCLVDHCVDDLWMAMVLMNGTVCRKEIEIFLSFCIINMHSLTTWKHTQQRVVVMSTVLHATLDRRSVKRYMPKSALWEREKIHANGLDFLLAYIKTRYSSVAWYLRLYTKIWVILLRLRTETAQQRRNSRSSLTLTLLAESILLSKPW